MGRYTERGLASHPEKPGGSRAQRGCDGETGTPEGSIDDAWGMYFWIVGINRGIRGICGEEGYGFLLRAVRGKEGEIKVVRGCFR